MYHILGNQIYHVRGDDFDRAVDIDGLSRVDAGDILIFKVAKPDDLENPVIYNESDLTKNHIHLEPSDTESLEPGRYMYQVRVNLKNRGLIKTVIPWEVFELGKEIKDE